MNKFSAEIRGEGYNDGKWGMFSFDSPAKRNDFIRRARNDGFEARKCEFRLHPDIAKILNKE